MLNKHDRVFLPTDFTLTNWDSVEPFYNELIKREIDSIDQLKKFLEDWSELEGMIEEDGGWRYIRASCDTKDPIAQERYSYFITDIEPQLAPMTHLLHKKVLQANHISPLRETVALDIFCKKVENHLRCYHPDNIPIQTDIQLGAKKYGEIMASMMVEVNGEEMTLQQAGAYLESNDRGLRQKVYEKIHERRLQDKDQLNDLYSTLIQQRHQLAKNAGFKNFRDYAFVAMHRFDYTAIDCLTFHKAIQREVVPLMNQLSADRKSQLGLSQLKPFDLLVDPNGKAPLRPFSGEEELIKKSISVFEQVDPFLAKCFKSMHKMGHLDLESRKHKAPGGYNYPLDETGVPFIFMNATSRLNDIITLFHEAGHAVHACLAHPLKLNTFKHTPSEIAELASMSMELLTMPYWDCFFPDQEMLNRAKKEHLTHIITCLAWIATIDAFQHWIYTHPKHTIDERTQNWRTIFSEFSDEVTDWSDYEIIKDHLWQKQLHLFELPFYYIEYAIAQLGAIGVWENSYKNRREALTSYFNALKLGHTQSMHTIYKTAGISFNFSQGHIRRLVQFVRGTYDALV